MTEYIISTSSGDHIYVETNKHVHFIPDDPETGEPPTLFIGGIGGSGTKMEFEDSEVTFEEVPSERK